RCCELRVASQGFVLLSMRSVPRVALEAKWGYARSPMFYVYVLRLQNGQCYTGFTKDLKARLEKHDHHSVPTTSRIRPEELLFYAAFKTEKKALAFEKYLKVSQRE
ncbi:MAG: GIY-YIG nuclease family protein, partial [Patescibacteria group bacterium]